MRQAFYKFMAAFCLIGGVAAISCTSTRCSKQPEHLCGAYTEQRSLTEEDLNVFRSAVVQGDVQYTPLTVATQVVAGLNYKFYCRCENPASGESGFCWIVIYQDLQGKLTVTCVETI